MNRAVFLDRDGTINRDVGYLNSPSQVELIDGSALAVKRLKDAGFLVVVISNQSGIARGLIEEEAVGRIHETLSGMLRAEGADVDGFYYCPHHPEGVLDRFRCKCSCRKPEPGLVLKASEDLDIDLSRSYVVGDKVSDVQLAYKTGCVGVMVLTGHGLTELDAYPDKSARPHMVCRDLQEAAMWIINHSDHP